MNQIGGIGNDTRLTYNEPMPAHPLRPFEINPWTKQFSILATLSRVNTGWSLVFKLEGPLNQLIIAKRAEHPQRKDELWKHTCFELFLREHQSSRYHEFNFSPSGDWAHYEFEHYRHRTQDERPILVVTKWEVEKTAATLEAVVEPDVTAKQPAHIGLSAVLCSSDKKLHYWALTHPAAEPDFHHFDSFTVNM
jgi:hypothetical protein